MILFIEKGMLFMETVIISLKQLGINDSLFYQLSILITFIILSNFIYIGRWSDIIFRRVDQNLNYKKNTDDIIQQTAILKNKYNHQLLDFKNKLYQDYKIKKKEFEDQEYHNYYLFEKEIHDHIKMSRQNNLIKYEKVKEQIWPQLELISDDLVRKLFQDEV